MNIDKEEYENITFQHDFQRDDIIKAQEIVKQYILFNKRILYGGMAIDFALKMKKDKLYSDFKLPDYDFMSSSFHIDAYTLGEQITNAGIDGVSVIRGLHSSTMRVRVNFLGVADITYVPENIYEKIPTLDYQGFKIVHPYYQMIDQHLSLSLPYANSPMEVIVQRWDKDMVRYDMLYKHYPVTNDKLSFDDLLKEKSLIEYIVDKNLINNNCIGGYPAFQYWLLEAQNNGYILSNQKKEIIKNLNIKLNSFQTYIPKQFKFTILTDDIKKIVELNVCKNENNCKIDKNIKNENNCKIDKNIVYYNSLIHKIPRRVIIDDKYEIIDNKGYKITSYHDIKNNIDVINIQPLMTYFLTLGNLLDNNQALNIYITLKEILNWACDNYTKDKNKDIYLKYLPTAHIYGKYNLSDSYLLAKENLKCNIEKIICDTHTPKNAYPKKGVPIKKSLYEFSLKDSPLYQLDGEKCEPFNYNTDL